MKVFTTDRNNLMRNSDLRPLTDWMFSPQEKERPLFELVRQPEKFLAVSKEQLAFALLCHFDVLRKDPMRSSWLQYNNALTKTGIDNLTREDRRKIKDRAHETIDWMKTAGLLRRDSEKSESFFLITEKGEEVLERGEVTEAIKHIQNMNLYPESLLPKSFPSVIRQNFDAGNYETTISEACKYLETLVRTKAGLPDSSYGKALYKEALNPTEGLLKGSKLKIDERGGIRDLALAINSTYRNTNGHRYTGSTAKTACRVLVMVAEVVDVITDQS